MFWLRKATSSGCRGVFTDVFTCKFLEIRTSFHFFGASQTAFLQTDMTGLPQIRNVSLCPVSPTYLLYPQERHTCVRNGKAQVLPDSSVHGLA